MCCASLRCFIPIIMGLFSALVAQSPSETKTSKRSQSLELPSLVQLYRTNPLRLETTALVPTYAVLSYSAVPVARPNEQDVAGTSAAAVPSKRSQSKNLPIVPELGVWNVCVPKRGSDALQLLPESFQSSSGAGVPYTFALTVDLSQPDQVEPTVSLLQDALIRFLIARPPPPHPAATAATVGSSPVEPIDEEATTAAAPTTTTATTSLYALRSVSFGLAPEDTASAAKLQGDAPSEHDHKVLISLIICARRATTATTTTTSFGPADPKSNNQDEYRAKQVQALLWYHLRRHAHALNATLCLVDDDDTDEPTEHPHEQQPAVALPHQLAHVWRELALGRPVQLTTPELGTGPTTVPSEEASEATAAALPLLYTPQQPHAELIESVVLRTATYPGVWDAAKESLWKLLPSSTSPSQADEAPSSAPTTGDEHWLTQLRDAVAAAAEATKTPSKPVRKEVAPDSAQKDAAVSSFFESLLK